jgi:hypothetical protein
MVGVALATLAKTIAETRTASFTFLQGIRSSINAKREREIYK